MSEPGLPPAAAVAAPEAVAPVIKSPRIKSFTLCDFRAFAGPEPVTFNLDGKNLLIFGENGAGKSSVFHALDEFFSAAQPDAPARKKRLADLENIFPNPGKGNVSIAVTFEGDTEPVRWDDKGHPADTTGYPAQPADARVVNGAYRKATLDYRALLDTNYRHGTDAVNLFDVCVRILLRDYPVTHNGKEERLFDLWRRMQPLPQMNRMTDVDRASIQALARSFSDGISEAIEALSPKVNAILRELKWDDVELRALEFSGVRFNWDRLRKNRGYLDCEITPRLIFRGKNLPNPQTFLNEARLSALALAIYFAGRQVCAASLQVNTPRLIVLDDVLIGLDQSNRMPVLRMLDQHFSDWQVILLTHDRVWYEMARFHLADRDDWAAVEMFEEKMPDGKSMPIAGVIRPFVKPTAIDAIDANIDKARKFHGMSEYAAAAVYARVAFELSLKKLCERKSIPVRFKADPRELSTEDLLSAIAKWLGDPKQNQINVHVEQAITAVRLARKVVLNQFSHSTPINLAGAEVKSAIDAVEALQKAFKDHIPTK
jgi:energy-coupling factor transporter ATP-binding protein EcfA2